MIEDNTKSKKVPAAVVLANRVCVAFAIFILPVVALKLSADFSYCASPILTILPRFSRLLDSDIASPSGICAYEIACALIFALRAMIMALFGHLLCVQFFGRIIRVDPGRLVEEHAGGPQRQRHQDAITFEPEFAPLAATATQVPQRQSA